MKPTRQAMESALDRIERLGHGNGPGFGFTCAEIAAEALGRPLRRRSGSHNETRRRT